MYKYIFFDLDHTLWDFDTNCSLTLAELYETYELHRFSFSLDSFIKTYKKINAEMWDAYNRKQLSKESLRSDRFKKTFEELGISSMEVVPLINEDFLRICPAKGSVYPHTHEILSYLQQKYKMCIITNGFSETQHIKIATSGLYPYFTHVVEAEKVGVAKPDKRIFIHCMNLFNTHPEECIMIGDDLYVDIIGARDSGIDQVFVNRRAVQHHEKDITYEISCLSELRNIL